MRAPSALAVLLLCAPALGAQGVVRGTVMNDQGRRLPGVELTVAGINKTVRSDSAGEYKLVLAPGTYWMNVRAMGYFVVGDSIEPERDVEQIHDFTLSSFGIVLDTVTTTADRRRYLSPGLRDFLERSKTKQGKFITEADFGRDAERRLPDVLRRIAGVTIVPGRGTAFFATASRNRSGCFVTVYLDGVLLYDRTINRVGGPPDLTQFQTRTMLGAEYYASTSIAPAQFRDRAGCGLLLLWSKER